MLTAPRKFMRHATFSADGISVKIIQNLLLDEELEKRQGRTKFARSCLSAAAYLIVFHRNSSSVYRCREIDMAVFEAPL